MQKRSSQLCVKLPTPCVYVTQLPEASTHPKYMSRKDETRGGADSIRAVTTRKVGPFYTGDGKGSRQKTERSPATVDPAGAPRLVASSDSRWVEESRPPERPASLAGTVVLKGATAPGQIEK